MANLLVRRLFHVVLFGRCNSWRFLGNFRRRGRRRNRRARLRFFFFLRRFVRLCFGWRRYGTSRFRNGGKRRGRRRQSLSLLCGYQIWVQTRLPGWGAFTHITHRTLEGLSIILEGANTAVPGSVIGCSNASFGAAFSPSNWWKNEVMVSRSTVHLPFWRFLAVHFAS